MNFKLGLREITESDIKADCPFMPEKEDFPMYVAAFVEDIDNLDIVESAYESNNSVIIKLAGDADIEQLRQACISIHQHYWDKLRTTGFEPIYR
ncbi:hypothetical protein L4D09_14205 [Photobacterium makurazakiensis]|uniref:hypothetical protein n=1 Tax=Photobacterium makurazakiensis TaxID=2910234 RepID=UPI003D118237